MRRFLVTSALGCAMALPAAAQKVQVEEFTLDNGMKFLLVPRQDQPNVIAAGWVAKVGSANERPGITGISHFFEHMMFKGTTTIGTNDPVKDREFNAKQKQVRDRLMELQLGQQYERWRLGEIDDPWSPKNDTEEMAKLRAELKDLMDRQLKETTVKDEFDRVYTNLGGSGMNAFTTYDLTFYFINVPSNKFELWAWMESDRLKDSVFREFYSERDVVHEERRLRTESTPTGPFEEQFDAMFWMASPYQWPVIGWTSDLNSYTREQAQEYFDIYYRPNNLVGVIVGDFNPDYVKPVVEKYFSRLERGKIDPPPVVTLEMKQLAEQRMYAECDCQPQVEVRYHTVPFAHKDSYALEVMAEILNGRTGRLYKSMVEGAKIASSASASAGGFGAPAKYAGFFSFTAETKGDATPEQLEKGWYAALEDLQKNPVADRELQKVKNRILANSYRRLQSNFFLLVQLGIYEAQGGWEYINESPAKLQAVTAADIQRVAKTYFDKTNRSVVVYTRKAGASEEDPMLAGLSARAKQMVKQAVSQLTAETDASKLEEGIAQMEAQAAMVPAEFKPAFEVILVKARERLETLKAAKNN